MSNSDSSAESGPVERKVRADVGALVCQHPMGEALAEHLPRYHLPLVLAGHGLAMLLLGWSGVWAVAAAALVFWLLRRAFVARLGGTTGDTAGALLELAECAVLLSLALFL